MSGRILNALALAHHLDADCPMPPPPPPPDTPWRRNEREGKRRTLKSSKSVPEKMRDWVLTQAGSLKPKRNRAGYGAHISRHARRTRPPLDLPYLPHELWFIILRTAIAAPSPPAIPSSTPVSFLAPPDASRTDYTRAQAAKLVFARVSRSWYWLAEQMLYEYVWIASARQAAALAQTLIHQLGEGAGGGGTSAAHIRTLRLATPRLQRCAARDIRVILALAPRLAAYADACSVRCAAREAPPVPPGALVHLAWTNYADAPFHLSLAPAPAGTLTFLELLSPNVTPACGAYLHAHVVPALRLPALASLKASLDNVTFSVLAMWDMPALANLSVVSADFAYSGPGFARFFRAHGAKLRQLELGHSSALIAEQTLTASGGAGAGEGAQLPLGAWCPRLEEFVCSADAEWNWQTPDWIAPHVLLPAHPTVRTIGVRDIHRRILDAHPHAPHAQGPAYLDNFSLPHDAPLFPLLEQLASLLRPAAFPSLQRVRDLSRESDVLRRRRDAGVSRFWRRVKDRCEERGVRLEGWAGEGVVLAV